VPSLLEGEERMGKDRHRSPKKREIQEAVRAYNQRRALRRTALPPEDSEPDSALEAGLPDVSEVLLTDAPPEFELPGGQRCE
jgi:hypothetical protein